MRSAIVTIAVVASISVFAPVSARQARGDAAANQVSQSLRKAWAAATLNIKESAEQMPEANYGFKPVDSVRTFGQILAHVAGANYEFCAAAKGEKSPHTEGEFEKSATTRAAIISALTASLTYCDVAFASMDDKRLTDTIDMPFGMGKDTRAAPLLGNIGHLNEHYGNLVTYFRIKGLVPPSSKR